MRSGYLHGDLKRDSAIFDGNRTRLIDFDQTVPAPEVAKMTIEEACNWADERKGQLPWRLCHTLRKQLDRFNLRKHLHELH